MMISRWSLKFPLYAMLALARIKTQMPLEKNGNSSPPNAKSQAHPHTPSLPTTYTVTMATRRNVSGEKAMLEKVDSRAVEQKSDIAPAVPACASPPIYTYYRFGSHELTAI
jgi:hypothetical protein